MRSSLPASEVGAGVGAGVAGRDEQVAVPVDGQRPAVVRRSARDAAQHRLRRLVRRDPHHPVVGAGRDVGVDQVVRAVAGGQHQPGEPPAGRRRPAIVATTCGSRSRSTRSTRPVARSPTSAVRPSGNGATADDRVQAGLDHLRVRVGAAGGRLRRPRLAVPARPVRPRPARPAAAPAAGSPPPGRASPATPAPPPPRTSRTRRRRRRPAPARRRARPEPPWPGSRFGCAPARTRRPTVGAPAVRRQYGAWTEVARRQCGTADRRIRTRRAAGRISSRADNDRYPERP